MPSAIPVSSPIALSSQCPKAGGQCGPCATCCWGEACGPQSLLALPGRAPAGEVSIHPSYRHDLSTAAPGGKKVGGAGRRRPHLALTSATRNAEFRHLNLHHTEGTQESGVEAGGGDFQEAN